jgi:MFS family permease
VSLSEAARSRLLLFLVAFGVFNGANDQTAIVVVLPSIISEIGLALDEFYLSSWIVNGYLLGYLVALPLVGRMADVFGHARVFVGTLVVFMVGSALVAVSTSFGWIVAARAIQAVGGGGVVPVSMAIVVAQLPPERRLMGLGAIAAAAEAGALIGPAWGGVITHWWGWRAVFWTNIPLVLPSLIGVWWLSRKEAPSEAGVDWVGAGLRGGARGVRSDGLGMDTIDPRPT